MKAILPRIGDERGIKESKISSLVWYVEKKMKEREKF